MPRDGRAVLDSALVILLAAKLSAFFDPRVLSFCASAYRILKNYLQLNISLLNWILIAPVTGHFSKISPVFRQMVFIGLRAAPLLALTASSVGVTLALPAAPSLERTG